MQQILPDGPIRPTAPAVIGLASLAKMVFDGADMAPLWERLTATLKGGVSGLPEKYAALMDMGLIDQMRGDAARGLSFQAQALAHCRHYQLPAQGTPARLTVLGFVMAGRINANTPIEFLLEGSNITLHLLYVVPGLPLPPVPEHDVAMVLAAQSDEALPILQELERLLAHWPRPVLNRPERIPRVSRECLSRLLASAPGVAIPATVRVNRSALDGVACGKTPIESLLTDGGFPLIVRPLDSHAGEGLEKLYSAAEMSAYLDRHADTEFSVSRFVDYRSPDGRYRKYRVMVIDGQPFPGHMAISDDWMIHYLNAGMLESAEKRAEEARFMERFPTDFGPRHAPAFAAITEALGLDYFGIDCAETPDGELLVFEAGTALVVHDMDSPDIFPYKSPPMRALFDAFREMLCRKARVGRQENRRI